MEIRLFQVDAFTSRLFCGNPAAVCPLSRWLEDGLLQNIALENTVSETAFFVPAGRGYALRWFTPEREVDLCGHATLASAFVLWDRLGCQEPILHFETRSGRLSVEREGEWLVMDFPLLEAGPCAPLPLVLEGLGRPPQELRCVRRSGRTGNYLAVYDSEEEVRALEPDMTRLKALEQGVLVTAPGDRVDFVSRYFVPSYGIPEDPVTGSSHCTLAPYWARRLGKTQLHAWQVSRRGGEIVCRCGKDRVSLAGRAVCYLEGTVFLDQ